MNESDETLERENSAVLKAIADLSKKFDSLENRFDSLEKNVNTHFEVIREGIAYNSARFDRLEAKVYDARSDISNLRADIKEMSEQIRRHITKDTLVLK